MANKKLLVIVNDRLSEIVKKGEITERYYNPGNFFDEVHILMLNNDIVSADDIQKTVGSARLILHNLPVPSFNKTLGWRPWLLKKWMGDAVRFVKNIEPDLIRCYGIGLNAYLSARIQEELQIPYAVSIHTQLDERKGIDGKTLKHSLFDILCENIYKIGIKKANVVLPVYKSIIPYLERRGIKNFEVVYNVLDEGIKKKSSYVLSNPIRVISVGRQIYGKNTEQLIKSIALLKNVRLTLVGDGPYHECLKGIANDCILNERQIEFIKSMPNDELCRVLPDFDIFATHTDYCEIPKAVMEALLSGLPVILNKRIGMPVPEYEDGDFLILVDNTVEGYYGTLKKLIEDDDFREELGRKAYTYATSHWLPQMMEEKVVNIYRKLISTPL